MRAQQFSIEHAATGIGVDFNELRTCSAEVEVKTQKNALRLWRVPCDRGCVRKHAFAPCRQLAYSLDDADQVSHDLKMRFGDINLGV